MMKYLIGLCALLLMVASYGVGYNSHEPQVIIRDRVTVKPVIMTTSPKVITETRTQYVYIPYKADFTLRPFRDLEELETWVGNYEPHLYNYNGGVDFSEVDCEDYSMFGMAIVATMDGYIMHSTVIENYMPNEDHMLCVAPIGNELYKIDPSVRPITIEYWRDLD